MNPHSAKCRSTLAKHSYQLLQLFRELVGFYDKACGLYANLSNSANEILSLTRASGYPAVGSPYAYRGALSMFDPKLSVRILIKHTEQYNKAKENMYLLLEGIKSVQEKMIQLQNQIQTFVEGNYPRTQIHDFLQETCPKYPVSIQEHLELVGILQSLVASKVGALIQSHIRLQNVKLEDFIVPRDLSALEKFVSQLLDDADTWTPLTSLLQDMLIADSRILADAAVSQYTHKNTGLQATELPDTPAIAPSLREDASKLHSLTFRITSVGLVPWLDSA